MQTVLLREGVDEETEEPAAKPTTAASDDERQKIELQPQNQKLLRYLQLKKQYKVRGQRQR